jgi:ketosteroid isomerase-like protein
VDNADVLRRFYAAWNDRNVDGVVAVFHEHAEVAPLLVPLVSSDLYHGRAGVARWYGELLRRFSEIRIECEQVIASGEQVVGIIQVVARDGDGTAMEARLANVCRVRDGQIITFEGADADDTLEELEW